MWDYYESCPELEGRHVFIDDLSASGIIISASRAGAREVEITVKVGNSRYLLRRHFGKVKRWMREYDEKNSRRW